MNDIFIDKDDRWVETADDFWAYQSFSLSVKDAVLQKISDVMAVADRRITLTIKNAILQAINDVKMQISLAVPAGDFFFDYDDAWVDTEDDFWAPITTVPIYAKTSILQHIAKKFRLQPIDILALTGLIQHIGKQATVNLLEYVTIQVKSAILQAVTNLNLPFGSIAWAWGENYEEQVMRHFGGGYYMGPYEPGWSGTGQVIGSEADEHLDMDRGEYMDSPVWNIGAGQAKINLGKYSRKSVKVSNQIRYRTTQSSSAIDNALWNSVSENNAFVSLGFVQVRLGSTSAGIAEGAFYDNGGFDWADDGEFNWE